MEKKVDFILNFFFIFYKHVKFKKLILKPKLSTSKKKRWLLI